MPGPRTGDLPPDLPPEYAEAYRRGYERAYAQGAGPAEAEQTARLETLDSFFHDEPASAAPPSHRRAPERERRRTLVPVLLVGLALLLVASAYGLGRMFADQVADTDTSAPEPDGLVLDEGGSQDASNQRDSGGGSGHGRQNDRQPQAQRYDGPLTPAAIGGATASCQTDSSVDASGQPVTYEPALVVDGNMSTAWRCDGDGVGQRVTIRLAETTPVGEVGLVPGYAKTDSVNGADRYAENNRITQVRWIFGDGTSMTQILDGSPANRSLQTMRIPETQTDQVTIEILASTPGPRNTVAISEVAISAATG